MEFNFRLTESNVEIVTGCMQKGGDAMEKRRRDIAIVLLTLLYIALLFSESCKDVCMDGVSAAIAILQMNKTSHAAGPHNGSK